MNKKEKLAFIENLKNNPRISNLDYDPNILKRGREDSIWYQEEVLWFTIDKRFTYECRAVGDVRITYVPTDEDVVSKGYHADDVVEFLEDHGLTTDHKVFEAERKGNLYFDNNNWFEDWIYDEEKTQYIPMDGADISDGPFTTDLDYLDEWIKGYLEEE